MSHVNVLILSWSNRVSSDMEWDLCLVEKIVVCLQSNSMLGDGDFLLSLYLSFLSFSMWKWEGWEELMRKWTLSLSLTLTIAVNQSPVNCPGTGNSHSSHTRPITVFLLATVFGSVSGHDSGCWISSLLACFFFFSLVQFPGMENLWNGNERNTNTHSQHGHTPCFQWRNQTD